MTREDRGGDGNALAVIAEVGFFFLNVVLCHLLSLLGCLVCTYILLSYRAVERRASRCWCSMGNPLHFQGSPVSTGCWEVLGYWVCLSLDQGSYRNRQ